MIDLIKLTEETNLFLMKNGDDKKVELSDVDKSNLMTLSEIRDLASPNLCNCLSDNFNIKEDDFLQVTAYYSYYCYGDYNLNITVISNNCENDNDLLKIYAVILKDEGHNLIKEIYMYENNRSIK